MSPSQHPSTQDNTTLHSNRKVSLDASTTVTPKQGQISFNYWLFVGTPVLVFLLIVLIVIAWILFQKFTCCRGCSIFKGQNHIENTALSFNNSTYLKFISLDSTSTIKQRNRSNSCPDFPGLDPNDINVMYQNIQPPTEDEICDVYVDPMQYNEQFEEASRLYRSENDINRVQIVSGSSHGKFQRLLTQLDKENKLFPSNGFAAYVKYNGANNVYKIPSNVFKFEPPSNTPPTVIIAPIKYNNNNETITSDTLNEIMNVENVDYTNVLPKPTTNLYEQPRNDIQRYDTLNYDDKENCVGREELEPFYHELEIENSYDILSKAD